MDKITAHPTQATYPAKEPQIILVIDDNDDSLLLQKLILETQNYKVFTAHSAAEALLVLTEIPQPSLILLDMQLKDSSGTDFLSRLQKEIPAIAQKVPVVFLSAMDNVPESIAVGHLRKPVEMQTLIDAVGRFIKSGTGVIYGH